MITTKCAYKHLTMASLNGQKTTFQRLTWKKRKTHGNTKEKKDIIRLHGTQTKSEAVGSAA